MVNKNKLRRKLEKELGCTIQHDGWPCGSCFHTIDIDLREDISEYWQPVLSVRGDYDDFNWDSNEEHKFPERVKELYNKL